MGLNIKIPDWAADGRILVLSNGELVAYKDPGVDSPVKVKKIRCNFCGECCMELGKNEGPFGADDEGKCLKLYKSNNGWLCGAGGNKPLICCGDPNKANNPNCVIEYEEE